jgi:hypothetical protein
MNKKLLLFFPLIGFFAGSAQDFTGQWRGEFLDKSSSYLNYTAKCEYVLELEVSGTLVSGASYTYFTDGGKRYYTICKLKGYIDKMKKYIEVKETERTKTNIPKDRYNCFQVHKLTYFKQGDTETIEGDWVPAPNQEGLGDCGYGTTILTRHSLKSNYPNFNTRTKVIPVNKKMAMVKKAPARPLAATAKKPVRKLKPEEEAPCLNKKETVKEDLAVTQQSVSFPRTIVEKSMNASAASKLERRVNKLLKTIEVENRTVKVDLYDNGEIDGDSVTVFYNGKLLLANKKLSDKPLSFNISVDESTKVNELVMYAENLGSIPPNTALMVVTDGPNRYEVRITSDLQKSGVINFVHKSPASEK